MVTGSNTWIYAQLIGIVAGKSDHCLVTATDITKRKLAEIELEKQNDYLSKITQFSIDLSALPATENLEVFITKSIKKITGAVGAVFSEYNPESGMLVPGHIELEPGLLKKILSLLGSQVYNVHSPVNEETYRKITTNLIIRCDNITDLTFGTIPKPVGAVLSSLLKADRYIGIAYLIEGKLYGTSVLALGKHLTDPSDEVLKNIAFLVAVSLRRKRAEEALLNEQWRLTSIIEGTNAGTWEWNVQTGEAIYNEQWANIIGYTLTELKTLDISVWKKYTHPEDLKKSNELLNKHFSGELLYYECECRMKHKNGHWVWVHDRGRVTTRSADGKPLLMFGTHIDITKRKESEQALKESESRFRRLYESASLGIFQTTAEGKIISVNPSFAKMFGYSSPDELKNKISNVSIDLFADPNRRNEIIRLLEINPELNFFENIYRRKDGSTFVGWLNVTRINDHEGRFDHMEGFIEDISQRKQAEDALRKGKEQYDKLAANIPVGVYILHSKADGSFKLDYASPRMAEMLNQSIESLLEDAGNVFKAIHPDDLSAVVKLNEDGIRLIQPFNWTGRIVSGGEIKWMHFRSLPELLENGDILWHGLIVDITKEKLAEDEITKAHNRLQEIASSLPGVVFQFKLHPDGTSCFPYASERIREIYGVSPEDVIEDATVALKSFHPDDIQGFRDSVQASAQNLSPWVYEYRVKHDGKKFRWLLGNALPQKEPDGSVLWNGFATDVTDRKQAEQSLKESEERFKNLFEHHSAIMLLIDPESGFIIDANDAATGFYGYSKSVLQSMKIEEINTWSDDQVKVEYEKARINNLNYFVFQHRLASGEDRIVEVHSSPIDFQEKQILFSVIHDITERKLAEKEIQHKNDELLILNAEKDKFFSIIAHDLRGPIGGFMGLTERMAEGMADMTLADLQKIARVIKKSASNLYSLLGNLLEWSLMQRGHTVFEPSSFLLMPVMEEIMILTAESAIKKGIDLWNTISDDLAVFADKNMLASIIRNLLANSVKFTPGGGKIEISAKHWYGNMVEISISDTGIGMSRELIANLFNHDVNTSRKGTDGELSTGLGLIICKDFIEKHGGELIVESEIGKGSTFRFTVPTIAYKEEKV